MLWLIVVLASIAALDFAWVTSRARAEWSRSDELSISTAVAINTLYVLAGGLMALALILRPWPIEISLPIAISAGAALSAGGIALTFAGARPFGSSANLYGVKQGGLIRGGVYSFSRNPQYAGLIIAFMGFAIIGRSALALVVAGASAAAFWLWIVLVEEPHLARAFGSRYEHYLREAPRFLGWRRGHTDLDRD